MHNKPNRSSVHHPLVLVAAVLICLAGCSTPLSKPEGPTGPVGTISLSIPHIATWVQDQYGDGRSAAALGARAFVIADSIVVKVLTAGGTPVVPETTLHWTIGNEYLPAYPTTTSPLNSIPVGTNYTVVVQVFNHAISTTVPRVAGTITGVNVAESTTTPVSVTCLPVDPELVTLDAVPVSGSIAPNGERWYQLNVTQGDPYYLLAQGPMAYFDQAGKAIATAPWPYVATYTGPVYIVCVDFSGFYGFVAQGSTSLQITSVEPVTNEGSVATPIELTPNVARTFKIGSATGASRYSYYQFTTSSAGSHFFSLASGQMSFELYSDSGFTTQLTSQSKVDYGGTLGTLAAGTTYYLRASGPSPYFLKVNGAVFDEAGMASEGGNEGSLASPVNLTLGDIHSGGVGILGFDQRSYYQFTTATDLEADIKLTLAAPSDSGVIVLFDDAPIASETWSDDRAAVNSAGHIYRHLNAHTTYYLLVINSADSMRRQVTNDYQISATMSSMAPPVLQGTAEAPLALDLNSVRTFALGSYGSGYELGHYQFTTTVSGDYALDINKAGFALALFADADFTDSLPIQNAPLSRGAILPNLEAATTYYFTLQSNSAPGPEGLGQMMGPAEIAAARMHDHTPTNPEVLLVGEPSSLALGDHTFDAIEYFQFTTGNAVDYSISLPTLSPSGTHYFQLSTDQQHSHQVVGSYFSTANPFRDVLSPNTTYYLKVDNLRGTEYSYIGTLLVAESSVPTFSSLAISASPTMGVIAAPNAEQWYEATVTPGKSYRLDWTGNSGFAVDASAFNAARSAAYFKNQWSQSSLRTAVIPTGETKLYIRMRAPDITATGTFNIALVELP